MLTFLLDEHNLRGLNRQDIPEYAAPARRKDYSGLPPAYTFVCAAEPFYAETISFIEELRRAGVTAEMDVYPNLFHAFDMLLPHLKVSRQASKAFELHFEYAVKNYFSKQKEQSEGGSEKDDKTI